jgi:hypothetical protein
MSLRAVLWMRSLDFPGHLWSPDFSHLFVSKLDRNSAFTDRMENPEIGTGQFGDPYA